MEFNGTTLAEMAEQIAIFSREQGSPLRTEEMILFALQHVSNRGGLREVLANQKDWSLRTFGPGRRTIGITKHIEKECAEVRDNPDDLSEWVDIMILAMDGYWRAGGSPEVLLHAIIAKQSINRERTYLKTNEDEPSEHVRECHPHVDVGSTP